MNARSGILLGALALAAAAGAFFALGGPAALRGRDAGGIDGAGGSAPASASAGGPPAAGGAPSAAGKASEPGVARLFGRPKAERKGVGAVLLRVVRWRDQTPVEGAQLLLSGEGNGGEAVDARIATDAQGIGSFPSLPAGDAYVLRVEAKDEPSTVLPGVVVEAGATRDLGTVFVGKKSGLAGRVVDERGAPVVGSDVRAYAGYAGFGDMLSNLLDVVMTIDREPTPIARATSDAKGEFAIPDLSPGPVTLRATSPGKRQAVKSVKVGAEGATVGGTTLVLEPGAFVAGIVVDGAGTPVPGAQLSMMSQDMPNPDDMMFGRTFATTDAAGKFRATVPEGTAKLIAFVAAAGYPTAIAPALHAGDESVRIVLKGGARLDLVVLDKDTDRPIEGASVMIAVGETADEHMDKGGGFAVATTDAQGTASVVTQPGFVQTAMVSAPGHGGGMFSPSKASEGMAEMFGGTIENDVPAVLEDGKTAKATIRLGAGYSMKGRVLDPQGKGIAGAELRAVGFLGGSTPTVRSASDGSYRLTGLTPMSMTVVVHAPGWVQSQEGLGGFGPFSDSNGEEKETPKPGAEIVRDIAMRPAAIVRGRVVDAAGNGIAGAQVSVDGASSAEDMFPGKASSDGISAPDGSYVLFDVNAQSGGESDAQVGEVLAKDTLPKEPDAKDTPLRAGLAGKTTEKESEKKKGIRIRAEADGWVSAACEPFEAKEGGTTNAPPIVLSRGATLAGVVKDAGGHPVAGARIEASVSATDAASSRSSRGNRAVRSREDGAFTLDVLPKGSVTLTVSAAGLATGRKTVQLEAPDTKVSLEVRLRQGVALRGRVVGSDGRPLAKAKVSIEGFSGDDDYVAAASATTDSQGEFSIEPVAPGRVDVSFSAEGHKGLSTSLVAGTASSDVVLEKLSPEVLKRLKEIDAETAELMAKIPAAGKEANAVWRRVSELAAEKRRLQGESADVEFTPIDAPQPK